MKSTPSYQFVTIFQEVFADTLLYTVTRLSTTTHTRASLIRHFPRKHLLALGLLGAAITALALTGGESSSTAPESIVMNLPAPAEARQPATPQPVNLANALPPIDLNTAPLPKPDAVKTNEAVVEPEWMELVVKKGDSVSALFQRAGLSAAEAYRVTQADKKRLLYKIRPGELLRIQSENDKVRFLEYQKSPLEKVVFNATESPVTMAVEVRQPEVRLANATGVIKGSLFMAGTRAGLSDRQTMNMAGIFGHVIDLVYDLREGDHFHVVYEELYLDGEKIDEGKIIAAEFVNQGDRFSAYRYTDSEGNSGYFDENGVSMRKAFLLAPLNYSRISSNFNLKRKHPVLNRIRAHKGTDYAAPTGTPIYASGDGRVSFSGVKGGYGKTVYINHAGNIQTRYAHMSRIKARTGARVKQGQVIGYVGATGLASGPHLHYEFILNGVHRNPRTILAKLPKAVSLAKSELPRFKKQTASKVALIEGLRRTELALLSNR